jgi:hypothetical protein
MKSSKKISYGIVKHLLPGRVRIKAPALLANIKLSRQLEHALLKNKQALKARVRPASGCLVIWYDPKKFKQSVVLDEIGRFLVSV